MNLNESYKKRLLFSWRHSLHVPLSCMMQHVPDLGVLRNPLHLAAATFLMLIVTGLGHFLIATAVLAPLPGVAMVMMVVDMDMHMILLHIDLINPMGVVMMLNALEIETVRVVVVDFRLATINCRSGISGWHSCGFMAVRRLRCTVLLLKIWGIGPEEGWPLTSMHAALLSRHEDAGLGPMGRENGSEGVLTSQNAEIDAKIAQTYWERTKNTE